ncbi:MAG: hypothetical protein QOI55_2231, partial [Actinomycetota bacterium]|nr:hypothetical protein [Actinomycetota bacterium]
DLAENAPNFAMGYAAQRYAAERAVGAHDALLPALEDLTRRHPQVVAWRAAYARALAEAGQQSAAATVLDDVVERLPGSPRNWAWVAAVTVAAEAAARLAAAPAATVLEPLLAPYAGQLVVIASGTSCEGAVDRYRALIAATCGDDDTAARRFEAALALEDGAGAPALTVRTKIDFAALLRRAGTRAARNTASQLENSATLDMDRLGLVHEPAIPR